MLPITVVFKVNDAALLDKARAVDKVMFSAEKIDGAFTVTAIRAEKQGDSEVVMRAQSEHVRTLCIDLADQIGGLHLDHRFVGEVKVRK
jgi:hypothetical protein